MDRVNQIWKHPLYQTELHKLQLLEADREFCRHTPEHFLDVARLAYIRALEENYSVSKELIYRADKKSRNCFSCKAEPECYWSSAKKNMTIQY